MNTKPLLVIILTMLATACFAQAPADAENTPTPEQAAVLANEHAYEEAYAKGDVKAIGDLFADDAEFTDEEGHVCKGRAEIEDSLRAGFAANKGAKLDIKVDSVRLLAPQVILEKGSTTVTSANGETNGALYTAIHTKAGDKWKLSQVIESPLPAVTAHDHLTELQWLVGQWEDTDKKDNVAVRSQYDWARGGNFITRNVTVKKEGETALEGWQIIGWDPTEQKIRVWTFDDEGGFSNGYFTRQGDRWLLRQTGVTPEGDTTSSEDTYIKQGDDKITFESNNRTLDGDPQPAVGRIEIQRVKEK